MTVTPRKQSERVEDANANDLFSPRFRSVAAMAGWDEEALLLATLVVEDTPDRQKKRPNLINSKSPPTKRRRAQRSPCSIPMVIVDLDEDSKQESEEKKIEKEMEKKSGDDEVVPPSIPCMDQLREELSCAICLEICFEPSTTSCGHSFCKKCLQSAVDKCGKRCPKCRDRLIRNGRSYCTVNTVIWNTIQLLFPKEVEARMKANNNSNTSPPPKFKSRNLTSRESESETTTTHRRAVIRRQLPSQNEDAALALRLQREEFMSNRTNSLALVRANLRAMASRAAYIRRAR